MKGTAIFLALLLAWGGTPVLASPQADTPSAAQGSEPQQNGAPPPRVDVDELPIDLEKIRRELERQPAIVLEAEEIVSEGLPIYRVRVEAREPSIHDILGPDYLRGPVEAGAMTHQEFLNLVTPEGLKGYAPYSNAQAATVAITSLALQWALKTAIEKFRSASDERAKAAARKEVQEALEALRKARLDAGLDR